MHSNSEPALENPKATMKYQLLRVCNLNTFVVLGHAGFKKSEQKLILSRTDNFPDPHGANIPSMLIYNGDDILLEHMKALRAVNTRLKSSSRIQPGRKSEVLSRSLRKQTTKYSANPNCVGSKDILGQDSLLRPLLQPDSPTPITR